MQPSRKGTSLLFSESQLGIREPVLVIACLLGIPCRWHGRRPKKRDALIARLQQRYVLVPVCPEQLGGMSTPRTGETLCGHTGADVLDRGYRIIAPETGEDVTGFYIKGAQYTLEMARIVGVTKAYLKSGSPACDIEGVTGETLLRAGIKVIRVG
ncbi:MAG: DUF523 domain-containing protein [Phycisphaerae bacterium]|nr:DUF523 domain-containing protein [Phycisphaerae bacterium]